MAMTVTTRTSTSAGVASGPRCGRLAERPPYIALKRCA